jgi:hypothetical protein
VNPDLVNIPATFRDINRRDWLRFAKAGYDSSLGSFCVGPQELEKWNPKVLVEVPFEKKDPAKPDKAGIMLLRQTWTIPQEKLIMPQCYCNSALDTTKTDLFTSRQVMQVVVADCCGVMTTVNPSTENTREGMVISDTDSATTLRTKPVPEVTIGNGQNEQTVGVPNYFDLNAADQLTVTNKGTANPNVIPGNYKAGEYKGDFDLTAADFKLESSPEPLAFFDPIKTPDMVIHEDERVEIKTGGYDNVDGMTNFKGLGKTQLKILNDKNEAEILEYTDETGAKKTTDAANPWIQRVMTQADPFKFDPAIRVFHVFRNPGVYKATYQVTESLYRVNKDGAVEANPDAKSSELTFNITVLDVKSKNRTIENQEKRQN